MGTVLPEWARGAVERYEAHVELLTMAFCHKHGKKAVLLHHEYDGSCLATLGDIELAGPWTGTPTSRAEIARGAEAWHALTHMEPEDAVLILRLHPDTPRMSVEKKTEGLAASLREEARKALQAKN